MATLGSIDTRHRFTLRRLLLVAFAFSIACGILAATRLTAADKALFACWILVIGLIHCSRFAKTAAILSMCIGVVALVPNEFTGYPSVIGHRAYTQFVIPSVVFSAGFGLGIWVVIALVAWSSRRLDEAISGVGRAT